MHECARPREELLWWSPSIHCDAFQSRDQIKSKMTVSALRCMVRQLNRDGMHSTISVTHAIRHWASDDNVLLKIDVNLLTLWITEPVIYCSQWWHITETVLFLRGKSYANALFHNSPKVYLWVGESGARFCRVSDPSTEILITPETLLNKHTPRCFTDAFIYVFSKLHLLLKVIVHPKIKFHLQNTNFQRNLRAFFPSVDRLRNDHFQEAER